MNSIIQLMQEANDLWEQSRRGGNVDDATIETMMEKIKNEHNKSIDNDTLLDEHQKQHRKDLYAAAVREMKKYCKQAIDDNRKICKRRTICK